MDNFVVKSSPEMGRYAEAAKDLKAGEVIFEETPFCVGPKCSSRCCCLECFCFVDPSPSGSRCPQCLWPLCAKCVKKSELKYHKRECEIFRESKCKFQNIVNPSAICLQFDCITPLRVLLEKEENPARWKEEVQQMEDHENERRDTPQWNVDNINIAGYLLTHCKLKEKIDVDEDLIQKAIGILEINAFEAKTASGDYIRCLYPKLAILAHSCVPNTAHSIFPSNDFKLQARSTVPVSKGSMIYSSYTYTMNGTIKRQEHLKQGKFFECQCERCLSPTELGTNFSTLMCDICLTGHLIPNDPPSSKTWSCQNDECMIEFMGEEIEAIISSLEDHVDEILYAHSDTNKFELIELLLLQLDDKLHKNHYLIIFVKNILIDFYSKMERKLPEKQVERKIQLCEEVLEVLNTFEAGKTRSRAMMLYEICKGKEILAKTKEDFQICLDNLSESIEILRFEDGISVEGQLAKAAKLKFEQIRQKIESSV